MEVIEVRNVNEALPRGLRLLKKKGVERPSRNGPVLVMPTPVVTVYRRPLERVLFDPVRDANPFFHLMESVWMLAGRDDVAFPRSFVKRMEQFSDDGYTFWGAYGFRWRKWFGHDQLNYIIEELTAHPDSRRAVLTIWDGALDPGRAREGGKDIPCNTQVFFWLDDDDSLEMSICNRSNDIVWGAYGANAVHFSYLMQYVAESLGAGVGRMYQFSNNYHVYPTRPDVARLLDDLEGLEARKRVYIHDFDSVPLFGPGGRATFDKDLEQFFDTRDPDYRTSWFKNVAEPMFQAHRHHRAGEPRLARAAANKIADVDWQYACLEWLDRRADKKVSK